MAYGIDVELLLAHGFQHALLEHQGGDIGERNDGALLAGQPAGFAESEESFDLLVHAAHGLHLAELVDRPGDREALLERRARDGRDQRAAFAERGTVAVDVAVGLLQRDARRYLQWKFLRVAAAQVAGEDHHALGVNRLAQIDLALDVDDARAARIDGGGDPRRHAERRVAHFQHRQAVAFADGGAFAVDQDDAGEDVFQDARRHTSGPRGLGFQRALDVADVGHVVLGQLANEIRLADQLEQIADARRQPSLVLGQACAVSRQARHRRCTQRRHAFLGRACLQQLGELLEAVFGERDVLVEIHQHAEHFLEVRIQVLQRVVELARADDDHLDVERDDFRRQGDGGQAAQFGQRRLHAQLA